MHSNIRWPVPNSGHLIFVLDNLFYGTRVLNKIFVEEVVKFLILIFPTTEASSRYSVSTEANKPDNGVRIGEQMPRINESSAGPKILKNFKFLSISDHSYIGLQTSSRRNSFENSTRSEEENPENYGDYVDSISFHSFDSIASAQHEPVTFFFLVRP